MTILRGKFLIAACLVAASGICLPRNARAQGGVSEAQAQPTAQNYNVGVTNLAIRPSAGAILYNGNERFAGGAMLDFNLLTTPIAKIGPSFGALYSSTTGPNYLSGVSTSNNQYIIQMPANLKAMVSPPIGAFNNLAFGVHGGANIIRTSSAAIAANGVFGGQGSSANLATTAGGSWDVHPNVGADIEYNVGTNFGISLRPDVTLMSAYNMMTLTLGLALQL